MRQFSFLAPSLFHRIEFNFAVQLFVVQQDMCRRSISKYTCNIYISTMHKNIIVNFAWTSKIKIKGTFVPSKYFRKSSFLFSTIIFLLFLFSSSWSAAWRHQHNETYNCMSFISEIAAVWNFIASHIVIVASAAIDKIKKSHSKLSFSAYTYLWIFLFTMSCCIANVL